MLRLLLLDSCLFSFEREKKGRTGQRDSRGQGDRIHKSTDRLTEGERKRERKGRIKEALVIRLLASVLPLLLLLLLLASVPMLLLRVCARVGREYTCLRD